MELRGKRRCMLAILSLGPANRGPCHGSRSQELPAYGEGGEEFVFDGRLIAE